MADRKKLIRKRKETEQTEIQHNENEPSKLEYDVAKYLRSKLPKKSTTLLRDKVDYFIASKAIDCLLDSKWASTKQPDQDEPLFTTRESIVEFLNVMLEHRLFHRASKIVVVKDKKKNKDADDGNATDSSLNKKKDKKKANEDQDDKKEKKKEKKKIKLDIHMDQVVVDSNEPYVWLYEPVSIKSWIFGFLLVIGVVGICLFPLWPSTLRDSVYYLSLAAASFILLIIGLAMIKGVLFLIVWTLTFGKHHFWLLPNLTEDVGFFASFVPLYEHKLRDDIAKEDKEKSKKNKTVKDASKKKRKLVEEEAEQKSEQNRSEEDDAKEQPKQEENSDSSENEKFEIVDDNEIPPILRLDL